MANYLVLVANGKDGTISSFDYADGKLYPSTVSQVGAPGMPLAYDPIRNLVYAGTSSPFGIQLLSVDIPTGTLTKQAHFATTGAPVYLSLAPDASKLYMASYHQGFGAAFNIAEDGSLTQFGELFSKPNLHSVLPSDDGKHCYFACLREDKIICCQVSESGLVVFDEVAAPAECGPRHMVFNADQSMLYVNTEFSGEVLRYQREAETGRLEFCEQAIAIRDHGLQHSSFGLNPRENGLIWGADIHLANDERTVFYSERNCGTVSALALNADGSFDKVVACTDVVPQPRAFAIMPDNHFLVASEIGNKLACYQLNPDFRLALRECVKVGFGASWIEVIEYED